MSTTKCFRIDAAMTDTHMTDHLDYNEPASFAAATELLRRHDLGEPEANITSAVRDFLIATRLARSDEIVEEDPPAQDCIAWW